MKKSKYKLSSRVHLTEDQYERMLNEEGEGASAKFEKTKDGYELSLRKARALLKAKAKARRFILYTDQIGRRLYIGDNSVLKLTDEYPLTFQKHLALKFVEGFDSHELKSNYYSKLVGLKFKHHSI